MFVARNQDGAIIGAYTSPQPGKAEEWLADDNLDLLTFLAGPVLPDWEGLKASLRGTSIFLKAMTTTSATAWTLAIATLNSNSPPDDAGRLADFQQAIAGIRAGLTEDLTAAEVDQLNATLIVHHFPFQIS